MQVTTSSFYSSQLLLKGCNSVLSERQIQEMFYRLGGILQNIFIIEEFQKYE